MNRQITAAVNQIVQIVLQGAQRRCQRSPQIGRTDLRQIKRSLPVVLTNSAQGYGIGKPIRKVQIKRLDFAKFQFRNRAFRQCAPKSDIKGAHICTVNNRHIAPSDCNQFFKCGLHVLGGYIACKGCRDL